MMRLLILAILVVGCSIGVTGCGLIANGVNRTANILTTPRRFGYSDPQPVGECIRIDLPGALQWT